MKEKIIKSFKNNYFKHGSYSVGITVLVIAAVLVLNLIIGELPAKYKKIDVSPNQIYTVGKQTKNIAKDLAEDVTIYYICESGSEDATLKEFLEKYESLSGHIKVETKDPVVNPGFVSQYTSETVNNNSLIVVSGERSKVIMDSDIYDYDVDYNTYSYTVTGFDGEGQITSAIDYVTSENIPVLYTLEGHGEAELDSDLQSRIEKQNIEISSLNLLSSETVPEDAACILMLSPTSDISEQELEKLNHYMEGGGNVFLVTTYSDEKMEQIDSLLKSQGLKVTEGIVMEGSSENYFQGYPYYLLPNIESHDITKSHTEEGRYVLLPVAQGIEQIETEESSSLNIESLLTTSGSAYSKTDLKNADSHDKEDGDADGPFDLGTAVTKTYSDSGGEEDAGDSSTEKEDAVQSKLVYVTTPGIFDSETDSQVSNGNSEFVTNALSWLCDQKSNISIASKSVADDMITVTSGQMGTIGFLVAAVLPAGILIFGGVVWFRRRKK